MADKRSDPGRALISTKSHTIAARTQKVNAKLARAAVTMAGSRWLKAMADPRGRITASMFFEGVILLYYSIRAVIDKKNYVFVWSYTWLPTKSKFYWLEFQGLHPTRLTGVFFRSSRSESHEISISYCVLCFQQTLKISTPDAESIIK